MPSPLQLHAARTRDAMRVDRGPHLAGRWTPATWALIRELADLVEALHPELPRRFADMAVSRWIIARQPIGECVAAELEERHDLLPVPSRDAQGFAPRESQ